MGVIITKPDYKGEELKGFLTAIYFGRNLVDRFTILPNVKDKFGMNFLDFTGTVLGPDGCDFDPNVNAALTTKQLNIDTYSINYEECIQVFEASYLADTLRAGANGAQLPPTFQAWLMEKLPAKIGEELERKTFSEIEAELIADANSLKQTIAPLTITNFIGEIGKVYDKIPEELFGHPELVMMMNVGSLKKFQRAAFDTSVPELTTDGIKLSFLGIPLEPAPTFNALKGGGLSADTIIAGLLKNFVRAADLVSDDQKLTIIDMSKTSGDDKIRVKGRVKFKATYGISQEIVIASPTV